MVEGKSSDGVVHGALQTNIGRRGFVAGLFGGAGLIAGSALLNACSSGNGSSGNSGSGSAGTSTGAASTPAKITGKAKITLNRGVIFAPWYIAAGAGLFKKAGVDFTLETANLPGSQLLQLLVGGKVSVTMSTPGAGTNNSILGGAPLTAVACGPVLNQQYPDGAYLVSAKAWKDGVRDIKSLVGRKVGLFLGWDSLAGLTLDLLAKKAGIDDPMKAFKTSEWHSFPDLSSALVSGVVDAMISQEPFTTKLVSQGAHPIGYVWEVLPNYPGVVAFMDKKWVEANKDTTIGIMKAYLMGIRMYKDARDAKWPENAVATKLVLNETQLPLSQLRGAVQDDFPSNGLIPLEPVTAVLNWAKQLGDVKTIVPTDQWIDPTYVTQAYNELVASNFTL